MFLTVQTNAAHSSITRELDDNDVNDLSHAEFGIRLLEREETRHAWDADVEIVAMVFDTFDGSG